MKPTDMRQYAKTALWTTVLITLTALILTANIQQTASLLKSVNFAVTITGSAITFACLAAVHFNLAAWLPPHRDLNYAKTIIRSLLLLNIIYLPSALYAGPSLFITISGPVVIIATGLTLAALRSTPATRI